MDARSKMVQWEGLAGRAATLARDAMSQKSVFTTVDANMLVRDATGLLVSIVLEGWAPRGVAIHAHERDAFREWQRLGRPRTGIAYVDANAATRRVIDTVAAHAEVDTGSVSKPEFLRLDMEDPEPSGETAEMGRHIEKTKCLIYEAVFRILSRESSWMQAEALGEQSTGQHGDEDCDEWRIIKWFEKASNEVLNYDQLYKALGRKHLNKRETPGKIQLSVAEVCRMHPECRAAIHGAIKRESGSADGQLGQ